MQPLGDQARCTEPGRRQTKLPAVHSPSSSTSEPSRMKVCSSADVPVAGQLRPGLEAGEDRPASGRLLVEDLVPDAREPARLPVHLGQVEVRRPDGFFRDHGHLLRGTRRPRRLWIIPYEPALRAERAPARDVPRDGQPLERGHQEVEDEPDDGQHDERGEQELGAEVAARHQEEVAEAAVRADELADDRPDRGEGDRDLEPGEDLGQGVREPHLDERRPRPEPHRAREVLDLAVERAEPRDRVDHDRERTRAGTS